MYLTSAGTQIHTVNHISAIPPPDSCFANENCLNPVTNEGYKQNDTCHPSQFNQTCHNCPQITCQFTRYEKEGGWFGSWMIWFNLFAFYWTMEFVTALGELVLAGVFSQWYWTHDKSKLPCCSLSARSSSSHLFTIPESTNFFHEISIEMKNANITVYHKSKLVKSELVVSEFVNSCDVKYLV